MPSTCKVGSLPARCSARAFRIWASAGLSAKVFLIHVATRTDMQSKMSECVAFIQQQSAMVKTVKRAQANKGHTFKRPNLGHKRADVADGQPVSQALTPDQRVLVDDAMHPALAQHRNIAGAARRAQPVPIVPSAAGSSISAPRKLVHSLQEVVMQKAELQNSQLIKTAKTNQTHQTFFIVASRM